jgi:hypothetical protein
VFTGAQWDVRSDMDDAKVSKYGDSVPAAGNE